MSEIAITNSDEKPEAYQNLLGKISATYTNGQVKATHAVNVALLETYWQIGQHIVEFEQGGKLRAEYGKALINNLAKDLSLLHGKGLSVSNVKRFRQFYHLSNWCDTVAPIELESFFYKRNKSEAFSLIQSDIDCMSSQLFVSKYQLYLPDKNDLINLISHTLDSETNNP